MTQKNEDSLEVFNRFTTEISKIKVSEHLQKSEQMYAVRQFKISQLSTIQALEIYQNIYIKFNRNMIAKSQLNWWENQLRVFVWVLILYVQVKNTKIQQLIDQDWQFFSLLFPHKKEILFEYQSINILKEHGQAKKWIPEEDELFTELVNEKGLKCKWSELAKLLYIDSERKFFRTPKQCRQRWLNHLDPAKSKSEWSIREDYILIRYVYEKQKRWAEISKLLQNKRNEHSIKNRFKSLITKEQKFHKEKLEQPELIKFVFKRYTIHFSKTGTVSKIDENYQMFSPIKSDAEKKPSTIQQSNLQENQENLSIKPVHMKSESEKLMYPFTWFAKNKDETSFIPFRKSQEYMTYNNFNAGSDKQFRDNMGGTNFTSMENFPGIYVPNGSENPIFSKFKSEINLPKRSSYLDEENQNQKHQTYEPQHNKYEYMMGEHFGNDDDLPLGYNYQQFLPQIMDEFEDPLILQRERINADNYLPTSCQMDIQKAYQIDDEEKRIRAEIFMTEDPFDLLKSFFYKKKSATEIKEKV